MDTIQIEYDGQTIEVVAGEIAIEPAEFRDLGHASALAISLVRGQMVETDPDGVVVLRTDEAATAAGMVGLLETLNARTDVAWAGPEPVVRIQPVPRLDPNDPLIDNQWHHDVISSNAAWDITTGDLDIVLAVVDSGIPLRAGSTLLSHPDLNDPARFLLGNNYAAPGTPPRDDNGHGTHVAGIAAAAGNNSQGVAGLDWRCRVLNIKVFDSEGRASVRSVAAAFREAQAFGFDNGARVVVNFSGEVYVDDPRLRRAVAWLEAMGVVVVAAAGNNNSAPIAYPARYASDMDNVIAVTATDSADTKSDASNFGPESIVAAPGQTILSTMPDYSLPGRRRLYGELSGTSMAAPLVAATATLVLAQNPNLSAARVRERVGQAAVDLGPTGRDNVFGYGRIDVAAALGGDAPPPGPTVLLSHLLNLGINLGWCRLEIDRQNAFPPAQQDRGFMLDTIEAARGHAVASGVLRDPSSGPNRVADLMRRGAALPTVAGAFDPYFEQLQAELSALSCISDPQTTFNRPSAVGFHLGVAHRRSQWGIEPRLTLEGLQNAAGEVQASLTMFTGNTLGAIAIAISEAVENQNNIRNAVPAIEAAWQRAQSDLGSATCTYS